MQMKHLHFGYLNAYKKERCNQILYFITLKSLSEQKMTKDALKQTKSPI